MVKPVLLEFDNGLKFEVIPNSDKWDGMLYASTPFINGEEGLFHFAANHLIEHCLPGPFAGSAETRSTFISHRISAMHNIKQAKEVFDTLGDSLTHLTLDPQVVEEQKRRIFEEWAGQSQHTDKFKFFGGMLLPVTFDKKDRIIDHVDPNEILHFINKQADYNQSFEIDELNQHARFIYAPQNLTLKIQTPLDIDTFKEFIKRTHLASVLSTQGNAQQISYRPTPDRIDYRHINSETLNFQFKTSLDEGQIGRNILNNMVKHACKEAGLYWHSRKITPHADTSILFSFEARITQKNKPNLLSSMKNFLDNLVSSQDPKSKEAIVAQKISKQLQSLLQGGLLKSSPHSSSR